MRSRGVVLALLLVASCGKKKAEQKAEEAKKEPAPSAPTEPSPEQPKEPPPAPPTVDAAVADAPPPPQWGGAGSCTLNVSGATKLSQTDGRAVATAGDATTLNCSGTHVQLTIQPADASVFGANKRIVLGKDPVTVSGAIDGVMLDDVKGTIDVKAFAPPTAIAKLHFTAKLPTGAVELTGTLDTCPGCTK